MIIKSKTDISKIKMLVQKAKTDSDLDSVRNELDNTVEDILCNKCGTSCKTPMGNFEGLIEVIASGGYESKVVSDETSIKFSLCEGCLGALISEFKHKPAIRDDQKSFDESFIDEVSPPALNIMPQNDNSLSKVVELISKKAKK